MSRIFMPRPEKNAATSGGNGAAALDTTSASPRPSSPRIGASTAASAAANSSSRPAGVHRLGHGGPLGLVLFQGEQRLDARPDLLPHPGHAEEPVGADLPDHPH